MNAFLWGFVSAVSLPLGTIIALRFRPGRFVTSSLMAFGAGALLFALSIELFGASLHHMESEGRMYVVVIILGAVLGGLLFDFCNQMLNNRGAFLRKWSTTKRHLSRHRIKNIQGVLAQLSRIKMFQSLSPAEMASLVQNLRSFDFEAGADVFKEGDTGDSLYIIVSGEAEVKGTDQPNIATLGPDDVFGELAVLVVEKRIATVSAKTDLRTYRLDKADFDYLIKNNPNLEKPFESVAREHIDNLVKRDDVNLNQSWQEECYGHLRDLIAPLTETDMDHQRKEAAKKKGAAMAIWLGILIDAIPESLVIGMLATAAGGMSMAFVVSVFLANFPEAMSGSVGMQKAGMKGISIFMMWMSICLITGIGAFLGSIIFGGHDHMAASTVYFVAGIEGLAAGAMLTAIAETMLPEAFEQGGAIVGFMTLLGFISAMSVKLF